MKTPAVKALSRSWIRFLIVPAVWAAVGSESFSENSTQAGMQDAPSKAASVKRDPFWPVGYISERVRIQAEKEQAAQKPKPKDAAHDDSWNEAMKKVVINGVSRRGHSDAFAVINGKVKSAGDTVAVVHANATYTWLVDSITLPSAVKLRRVSIK